MFQVPACLKTNSREIDFHNATSNDSNVLITRATQGAGAGAPRSQWRANELAQVWPEGSHSCRFSKAVLGDGSRSPPFLGLG